MHSSPYLFPEQISALRLPEGKQCGLHEIFPDYHPQDRVAVVSHVWEDAFEGAAAALTALTALFYEAQRSSGKPFFNYPAHYLLIHQDLQNVRTRSGHEALTEGLARPWALLDVWPDTQWIAMPDDAHALLNSLFTLHIHRVFLPARFAQTGQGPLLPDYARKMMGSRLKSVCLYHADHPDFRLETTAYAGELVAKAAKALNPSLPAPLRADYRRMESGAFLDRCAGCFNGV